MTRRFALHRGLALPGFLIVVVLVLGWIAGQDFRRSAETSRLVYDRMSAGLNLINELQFTTQEVRRTLLYALHTSDANRQLAYADQSRAADARVRQLIDDRAVLLSAPATHAPLQAFTRSWQQYLAARDEVMGLILEGSLSEGVNVDERRGTEQFNLVRLAIADLKRIFESDAEAQASDARAHARVATQRLTLLVGSALIALALAIHLGNRRVALEALLFSEAHKGSILQAVPDPVISADASGAIIEMNEAAERTFGFTRSQALGQPIEQMMLPESERGAIMRVFEESSAKDTSAPRALANGRRRDGTEFPMELAAVSHTAGRQRIWTLHVSDMTGHRRTEELLRQAKDQAEVATRAKSDFLATMSHELRTPLSGVVGIADLLQIDPSPRDADLIRMLGSSATGLLGLVNDILDYSRIEAGATEVAAVSFALRQCIEESIDQVAEPARRKGLALGYVIDDDVPARVVADQQRVRQVLVNLLSNAVKFTDAGEVEVFADAITNLEGPERIRIRVRDTGPGIPLAMHGRLFRRFSQVDGTSTREHGGAGLGLAISERLSRLLGGSLTVESAAGHGATFTFVFEAPPDPAWASGRPVESLPSLRVVARLGEAVVGRQIRALVSSWRAILIEAAPGEALEPPVPPGVLLVDATTDDGRGLAGVLEDRRAWARPVPIVVVTSRVPNALDGLASTDRVLTTPLRAASLHDALAAAAGLPSRLELHAGAAHRVESGSSVLRVLLTEDNDANRHVIRLMLEELGAAVDEATSGTQAIQRLRHAPYDVILMDVQMPGIDGLETTRRIREDHGKGPIILALTANVLAGEEARCRAAGMDGYLPKPLRLDTLASALAPLAHRRA